MRVLHAYNVSRFGGGANNAPVATIEASREHGLEVEVFTRSSRDLAGGLRGRVQAGAAAIYPAGAVRAFEARLAAFRPDVVHVHELFPLVSPWILPHCTRRSIPVVMTVLDYRLTCPVGTHLREGRVCDRCTGGHEHRALLHNCRGSLVESATVALFNSAARALRLYSDHVSRFVTPSAFTSRWLAEKGGVHPSRISTIPCTIGIPAHGVDPSAGRYVGCASRLSPEKGIETFVEAARLCGLPFRIARNETHLVKDTSVPAEIPVEVTRDAAGLEAFYRGARMLVFPSIWFETFGLVGAEAMSHGVPVIASRIGALADLVDDGVNGLLFEPGDARDLARKVELLWADPGLCRRFGQAAREKAAAQWSRRAHVEGLLAVYDELCGTTRRAPANDPEAARETSQAALRPVRVNRNRVTTAGAAE